MAKSVLELIIIFLLGDFEEFYSELVSYYDDVLVYPDLSDIVYLERLRKIIKSSNISDEDKKKSYTIINSALKKLINNNYSYHNFRFFIKEEDLKLIKKIFNGDIVLPYLAEEEINFDVNYNAFKYQLDKSHIFTLDKNNAVIFEQAYGINFDGKLYTLDIYLPDVISFFQNNKEVLDKAIERGETFYTKNGRYDMIPYPDIINHLVFKTKEKRNAIKFSFKFNRNGNMVSYDIEPVYIRISDHIDENMARKMLNSDEDNCIKLLSELINKTNGVEIKKHKLLCSQSIKDLIGFPSVFLNNFVSKKCDDLIFFNGKEYTSNPTYYASISTPIRKVVSDINLAIFLNHIGYFRLSDYEYDLFINRKEEIIDHLNERSRMHAFTKKYPFLLDYKK